MSYLDLLEAHAGAGPASPFGVLATRPGDGGPCASNPDHHLWNNRGTWWCHFTLHRPDYTAERVRVSLRTRDLAEARLRRDELLRRFAP
jgi:hypothetical protein